MVIKRKNRVCAYIAKYTAVLCISFVQAATINQADIDHGFTIDQSGAWQLIENVSFTSPYAIVINAPNVFLDLQGHTIDGQEVGQCALSIRADNCQVLNGTIKATQATAINLETTIGTQIAQVTIQQCQQGIRIANGQYNTIKDCIILTSTLASIIIADSPYTSIAGITIKDSSADGLVMTGNAANSTIAHAIISGCVDTAMIIESNAIFLTGLVLYKNGGNGLVITGNDVGLTGMSCSLNNGNGLLIEGQRVLVKQASIGVNGKDGIHLSPTSAEASIMGGISSGNTLIGINNLGATSNTAAYVDVRVNKVRDLWRIINSNQ